MAKRKAARKDTRAGSGAPGARARKRARKTAARKTAGRKSTGRTSSGRKSAARKTTGRNTAARKTATRKTGRASTTRTTAGRKTATRKAAAKKTGSRGASTRAGGSPKSRTLRSGARAGAGANRRTPTRAAAESPTARRRVETDDLLVPTPPSALDLDRSASAARSGRRGLRHRFDTHTETGPAVTGGDIDADWESAYSVGDEAPGGDNPTPDQDIVDDIGRALGVQYEDNEELKADEKIARRDRHRWELDPASSEDYDER